MGVEYYSLEKVSRIYSNFNIKSEILDLEERGLIPKSTRFKSGVINKKGWTLNQLPEIGEKVGFWKKMSSPIAMSIFTTKGGVLKSTLALNIARTAALHNIKTCVIGLDIQGDITSALGYENNIDDCTNIEEIIEKLSRTKGLADFFSEQVRLEDILVRMDLPNLFLIPETPELAAFNDSLTQKHRREYWLKEKVVDYLKNYFDLIIMDCSPNWNKLITNALVASDVLISPLECKINNFRNFKLFRHFINEFQSEMQMDFQNIFVPTKFSTNKKLSLDIRKWYMENLNGCTEYGIRESVVSEEATALNKSVIEHGGRKTVAKEVRCLLKEINQKVSNSVNFQRIERERGGSKYRDSSVRM